MQPDRKFAIVGHARNGTGYMSQLMCSFGYNVLHERVGKHGSSAWAWATMEENPPWARGQRPHDFELIKVIRDPRKCLWSIAYAYNDRTAQAYCRKYTIQFEGWKRIDNAALAWLCWNKIIDAQNPRLVVPVERAPEVMSEYLGLPIPAGLPPTNFNTKPKRLKMRPPADALELCRSDVRDEVIRYAGHLYPLRERELAHA